MLAGSVGRQTWRLERSHICNIHGIDCIYNITGLSDNWFLVDPSSG